MMRGSDERSGELFSYVDLEDRVPAKHPLRLIPRIVNEVLVALDSEFTKIYADSGRPSIPPERLLRALLLQAFYTIRSEAQLTEQLHYNLLYRWFVGLGADEPVWVPTVFTKNRERLLQAEVAHKFLAELLNHKEVRGLLSDEHFSVDGTQVAAWASMKSFRAKDGTDEPPSRGRNGERDFHGETRSNDTHASTTDPDARLYCKGKGKEAKLSYIGNALTENRHGLVVEAELGSATGTIEREAAVTMVVRRSPGSRRLTLGADKAYDVHGFVDDLRDLNVTPHIAQNTTNCSSAIDVRTTRSRLCDQSAEAQANRGTVRLGQDHRRPRPAHATRTRALTVQVHSDDGSLRPHPATKIARGVGMTGGTWSEKKSRSAKSSATIDLGPTAPADQAKSVQISVTCSHVRCQELRRGLSSPAFAERK
jgi:transposase